MALGIDLRQRRRPGQEETGRCRQRGGQFLLEKYVPGRPLLGRSPSPGVWGLQTETPRKKGQCGGEADPSA